MPTRLSPSRWTHGALALAVSGGYLLLVFATFAFVAVDAAFVEHPDASLAGVWLYLVTVPLSLVGILAVPDATGPLATTVLLAVPAASALVQAVGLWLALRGRPTRVH